MIISFSMYLTVNYMTGMEKLRAVVNRDVINEHFEQGIFNGKIATGILLCIGICTLLLGVRNKKGLSLQPT